jgi:DNA polymerase elongation subunit (family B)
VSVESIVDRTFNLEPQYSNYAVCANGSMYRKDRQGVLPKIMEEMFNERSVFKKKMLGAKKKIEEIDNELTQRKSGKTDSPLSELSEDQLIQLRTETSIESSVYEIKQMAKKVSLNSAYGCMGGSFFRFYDIRNAEAITYTGQAVIKIVDKYMNQYLQKISGVDSDMVIAGDTDSCFLHLDPIINKVFKGKEITDKETIDFLCNICDNNLQVVIDKIFKVFTETTNAYENHLHMKREKICSSGLWKAKKNYILHVWDNEGVRYSEPKIKISGIEAVKTSNPAVCRVKIKKAIEYIMSATEDDIIQYIKEFRQEFFSLTPEEISFPKRVSDIDKWKHPITLYSKGTPIHVRASLLYNNLLESKNLTNKYPVIKNGESIKYCYLRLPNPIREDVIGYVQTLPKEFGLHQYVDYQKQFELTFINPLTTLLDVIGWKTEKMPTLDDLF